jgi:hypothetical protein
VSTAGGTAVHTAFHSATHDRRPCGSLLDLLPGRQNERDGTWRGGNLLRQHLADIIIIIVFVFVFVDQRGDLCPGRLPGSGAPQPQPQ